MRGLGLLIQHDRDGDSVDALLSDIILEETRAVLTPEVWVVDVILAEADIVNQINRIGGVWDYLHALGGSSFGDDFDLLTVVIPLVHNSVDERAYSWLGVSKHQEAFGEVIELRSWLVSNEVLKVGDQLIGILDADKLGLQRLHIRTCLVDSLGGNIDELNDVLMVGKLRVCVLLLFLQRCLRQLQWNVTHVSVSLSRCI